MSEPGHKITCTDQEVRGHHGTVARCTCGWVDAWGVSDGSAEVSGHEHVMATDPAARKQYEERTRQWDAEREARRAAMPPVVAPAKSIHTPTHSHDCSCHVNPPCGACENCKHWDEPDCDNDCQDCEEDHE